MIHINQSPSPDSLLLDANNTVISISSSNGAGFYFRAKIYIDGVFFEEQSWSRQDHTTAVKNLKKLYNAYYQTIFNAVFINGLVQQTHLIKRVSIIINEHSIGDDSLVQTQPIPDFYLMYNAKPIAFDDRVVVQFLGINPAVLQLPQNGKIAVPFMVNAIGGAAQVHLTDTLGNTVDIYITSVLTEKSVYVCNFDLSKARLQASDLFLTLTITVGNTVISRDIRLFSNPKFEVKEIAFLNNFGYWCYAYLDGQLSIDNNLDVKTYEENDGYEKIYEINEKQTYSLNTGSLLASEKEIIKQITTALESKIYLNDVYVNMINATKKINVHKDRSNLYSESLAFSVKENNSVDNPFYSTNYYDSDDYDSNDYETQ